MSLLHKTETAELSTLITRGYGETAAGGAYVNRW